MMRRPLRYCCAVWLFALAFTTAQADSDAPYLYVLGVAQDAGYPQAGCYAAHCMPGWRDPARRRSATSLALIDPTAARSYLFEATPDLPAQLYALQLEAPAPTFALSGIFLTHAHIGHYAGLMFLGHEAMGASQMPVFAMPRMAGFLRDNGPWSQLVAYRNILLQPLQEAQSQALGSLRVTPFLVPHRDEFSETVGYRIAGPDKTAVFIPDIDKWERWDTDLLELVRSVDYALLDATFYSGDELPGRDMSKVPHPLVTDTLRALQPLSATERQRVWFIHMNHTNPLLQRDSEPSRSLAADGFNVAREGLRLPL
jgi:pyrroloquinoline quinone biosynthesis protein B